MCLSLGRLCIQSSGGLFLAELVADGNARIDISDFFPNRFAADVTADYLATIVTQEHAVRRRH